MIRGAILALLAGCAGFSGAGLAPGVATEDQVEKSMGPSADRRQLTGGEVVRFYSRLPAGRAMYAARFGGDGKLIAIEQRLTRENAQLLVPGKSTADDVRDLLGPPYQKFAFPRQRTLLWLYPMEEGGVRYQLNVEFFAADERVKEVRLYDEPDPD